MIFYLIILCYIIVYFYFFYLNILHDIIWLYCTILCCIIFYYFILYFVILYYAIFIILCYIVLCHIIIKYIYIIISSFLSGSSAHLDSCFEGKNSPQSSFGTWVIASDRERIQGEPLVCTWLAFTGRFLWWSSSIRACGIPILHDHEAFPKRISDCLFCFAMGKMMRWFPFRKVRGGGSLWSFSEQQLNLH